MFLMTKVKLENFSVETKGGGGGDIFTSPADTVTLWHCTPNRKGRKVLWGKFSVTDSEVYRMKPLQVKHTENLILPPAPLQSLQIMGGLHFWVYTDYPPPKKKVSHPSALFGKDCCSYRVYRTDQEQTIDTKLIGKLHLSRPPPRQTLEHDKHLSYTHNLPRSPKAGSERQIGRHPQSFKRGSPELGHDSLVGTPAPPDQWKSEFST